MDALGASSTERLVSTLNARLDDALHNPLSHQGFTLPSVIAIEEDLIKALSTVRWIRNTFAPANKLHPELLDIVASYVDAPLDGTSGRADSQIRCSAVCRHWRNSLLSFSGIWSSVDTTKPSQMKLYLARSREAPLHVNLGWTTSLDVFEQHILPERHRLRSLSIPFQSDSDSHQVVTQSLVGSAKSLNTLNMWMSDHPFIIPAATLEGISRFAPNITVLKLYNIFANLSSLKFPSMIKLTFRITRPDMSRSGTKDLIQFLGHSPNLEELDLHLPEGFGVGMPTDTVTLRHLKFAVFNGFATTNEPVRVEVLSILGLPKENLTVDVQTRARALPSYISLSLSAIRLMDTIFPQQSITAAAIHIKDDPNGFFGHISVCGERNNWVGLNHVRILNTGGSPFSRLGIWLDPVRLAPLRGIETLTLGLLKLPKSPAGAGWLSTEVLRTFLRGLDQVRVLNIYKMNVPLVARILRPSDCEVLLPSLEELRIHTYDPPELTRCVEHDKVHPGPRSKTNIPPERWTTYHEMETFRKWNHELHNMFFGRRQRYEEDMGRCKLILRSLEDYDETTVGLLRHSGIEKVITRISQLNETLYSEEKFGLKQKAKALLDAWKRLPTLEVDEYAKGSGFKELDDADYTVLRDMMRARRDHVGGAGRLHKVEVENASGGITSVNLP